MGEPGDRARELDRTRTYLRRRLSPLGTQVIRLLDHLDHMDQGDLDRMHAILDKEDVKNLRDELLTVHDDEQCAHDHEREGLTEAEEQGKPTLWQTMRDAFKQQ